VRVQDLRGMGASGGVERLYLPSWRLIYILSFCLKD